MGAFKFFSASILFCSLFFVCTSAGSAQEHSGVQSSEVRLSAVQDSGPVIGAWELGPTGTQASLRGIAAPSPRCIWACGSGGTVLRSVDGGSSWEDCSPDGFSDLEFRSIHVWGESGHEDAELELGTHACIASAGTPAVVLKTVDGGETWAEVFRHPSEKAFFDGMKFFDASRGIAFSDPVDGKLLVVETFDAGQSWRQIDPRLLPPAVVGEAGFAASNSSLAVGDGGAVWIGMGGAEAGKSRIYRRSEWGAAWEAVACPIPSGAAQGVFSIVHVPSQPSAASGSAEDVEPVLLVAVGGDYRLGEISEATAAISIDKGRSWQLVKSQPEKFRSAVVSLPTIWGLPNAAPGFLAVGPTGTDYSPDGQRWQLISDSGFHTLVTVGNQVFAVGSDGRFAKFVLSR